MIVHDGHAKAMRFFTSSNANSYDWVVQLATLGQDSAWKREIARAVDDYNDILELACGTGILSSMLARRGKNIAGIDLTFAYLRKSKHKVNAHIVQGTAESLPYRSESFDAIISSYLAKYVNLPEVIDECWRVLRPGGVAVFHDFIYPHSLMRSLWNAYFALLRLAGLLVISWKVVFEQLDDTIKTSEWVDQTIDAFEDKNFQKISCKLYSAGTSAIVSAEKP
ncbi:MAG: methyltransferase domain-containing protein [Thermoproteota archaeon]|jgi:demethylmenaquinone methyltransferase/2-methoxy-6-polyprenyl-1,4-benzoquinol methylase|nr:methyltransferase domain-containing protein [Thermoproteota archaeon]